MSERRPFNIPKPLLILESGRPPTEAQRIQAEERFQQWMEHPITTREQLIAKRDKAFGTKKP